MRIGFTGNSQVGISAEQAETLLTLWKYHEDVKSFHHGNCIKADEEAHWLVRKHFNWKIHLHLALSHKQANCDKDADVIHSPKPPLVRNKDIVDRVDILYATPKEYSERRRSGTWSTVRYARKQHIKVVVVYPDGSIGE